MSYEKLYIGICGIIAAGKTTLAEKLGKLMKVPVYYEGVIDNTYLSDFYKDMKKYSFPLQIFLLNKRFEQQQKIIWTRKGGVQDRTIYEDQIFAKMLMKDGMMSKRNYNTYIELFDNMSNFMKHPNLIVFLDVDAETAMKRIKSRNRNCEKNVKLEYLQSLRKNYLEFIDKVSKITTVIKIDYNDFHDVDKISKSIVEEYTKKNKIINVKM